MENEKMPYFKSLVDGTAFSNKVEHDPQTGRGKWEMPITSITNEQKIALIDSLLETARDPKIKEALIHSAMKDRCACKLLVRDGEDSFWISISYPDMP